MVGRNKNPYQALLNRRGAVLLTVLVNPAETQASLARKLGINYQHLNNDLSDLVSEGVLERHRIGRRVFYSLSDEAMGLNPDLELMATSMSLVSEN